MISMKAKQHLKELYDQAAELYEQYHNLSDAEIVMAAHDALDNLVGMLSEVAIDRSDGNLDAYAVRHLKRISGELVGHADRIASEDAE